MPPMSTDPPCLPPAAHAPPSERRTGSGRDDGPRGRTPWGWPAEGHTSWWGRGVHP